MSSSLHRTVACIDIQALQNNLLAIRRLVGSSVAIWPAVKADAYGHDCSIVVPALDKSGADGYCVATSAEGAVVRKLTKKPILLMGAFSDEDTSVILDTALQSAVISVQHAELLSQSASHARKTVAVHLKVDTGMGRVGIAPEMAMAAACQISAMPGLNLVGMMTHFACSDDADKGYTQQQLNQFKQTAENVQSVLQKNLVLHAANSGAILGHPDACLNMVRPGISMYGSHPGPQAVRCQSLKPVMTLKARIGFVKEVPPGTTISYGRTWTAKRKSRIATALIGYGDGLPRRLSNLGSALVNGTQCPIAGRVCMDMTMLDVTDAGNVSVGDWAVFWGYDAEHFIHPEDVAELLGTIPYELTCQVTPRVPRIAI